MIRSAFGNGSGRSSMPFTKLKMAVFAPIPRPRAITATTVKPLFFSSIRPPKRISWKSVSMLRLPQRGDRIDFHGPPRGEVRRNDGDAQEQQRDRGENNRICCADVIKQASQKPGQREGGAQTQRDASEGCRHGAAKDEPENVA